MMAIYKNRISITAVRCRGVVQCGMVWYIRVALVNDDGVYFMVNPTTPKAGSWGFQEVGVVILLCLWYYESGNIW